MGLFAFVVDFAFVFLYTVDKLDQVFGPPGNPRPLDQVFDPTGNPRPRPIPERAESDIDYDAIFGDPDDRTSPPPPPAKPAARKSRFHDAPEAHRACWKLQE